MEYDFEFHVESGVPDGGTIGGGELIQGASWRVDPNGIDVGSQRFRVVVEVDVERDELERPAAGQIARDLYVALRPDVGFESVQLRYWPTIEPPLDAAPRPFTRLCVGCGGLDGIHYAECPVRSL